MPSRRRIVVLASLFGPVAAVAGCSLIDSYGTVLESPEGAAGNEGGAGQDATTPSDGAGNTDAPSSVSDGTMETGDDAGGSDASDAGAVADAADATHLADGASDGMVASGEASAEAGLEAGAPPAGAVVIGGTAGTSYVLSVLDPTTGAQLSRVQMPVAGIGYDGEQDLWFLFDSTVPADAGFSSSNYASPGIPVTLHARRLDTHTGAWTEVGSMQVPPITSGSTVAVISSRIVYTAYATASTFELVVVDTSNPAAWTPDASTSSLVTTSALSFDPNGAIGTPGAVGHAGGTVDLLQNTSTGPAAGVFQFTSATVQSNGAIDLGTTPVVIGPATLIQTAGFGAYTGTGSIGTQDLFAVPSLQVDGGPEGLLAGYSPSSGTGQGQQTFSALGTRFIALAVSQCFAVAFVGQNIANPNVVFGIPLAGGTAGTYNEGSNGRSLSAIAFDPFTNTLITVLGGTGGNFIQGLALGGSATAPALSARGTSGTNSWNAPTDLATSWIATRQPNSFVCGSYP